MYQRFVLLVRWWWLFALLPDTVPEPCTVWTGTSRPAQCKKLKMSFQGSGIILHPWTLSEAYNTILGKQTSGSQEFVDRFIWHKIFLFRSFSLVLFCFFFFLFTSLSGTWHTSCLKTHVKNRHSRHSTDFTWVSKHSVSEVLSQPYPISSSHRSHTLAEF